MDDVRCHSLPKVSEPPDKNLISEPSCTFIWQNFAVRIVTGSRKPDEGVRHCRIEFGVVYINEHGIEPGPQSCMQGPSTVNPTTGCRQYQSRTIATSSKFGKANTGKKS